MVWVEPPIEIHVEDADDLGMRTKTYRVKAHSTQTARNLAKELATADGFGVPHADAWEYELDSTMHPTGYVLVTVDEWGF